MLYYPKFTEASEQGLLVHIPEAGVFLEKWLSLGEEFRGLSIRWAAGRDGQGSLVVIGVRHEGRGFDIAFRRDTWDELSAEPDKLIIRYGVERDDVSKETEIEIPEGSFSDFIDSCERQALEDPSRKTVGEIAEFYG